MSTLRSRHTSCWYQRSAGIPAASHHTLLYGCYNMELELHDVCFGKGSKSMLASSLPTGCASRSRSRSPSLHTWGDSFLARGLLGALERVNHGFNLYDIGICRLKPIRPLKIAFRTRCRSHGRRDNSKDIAFLDCWSHHLSGSTADIQPLFVHNVNLK